MTSVPDTLIQIGVGGTVAILVIREVLNFISRRGNGNGNGSYYKSKDDHNDHDELMRMVRDLHSTLLEQRKRSERRRNERQNRPRF